MSRHGWLIWACGSLLSWAALAAPPSPARFGSHDGRPDVVVPYLDAPPRLEAFLDMGPSGGVEQRMARVEGLVQQTPVDGAPASQDTHVYLGYDDDHLYAVFVAFDDDPESMRVHLSRREDLFGDEIVEIMLDTFLDQRRAYAFIANPLGVQWDAIWTEGQGFDGSFDTVWRSEGRVTESGYVVLMALPFRSLRFRPTHEQTWGVIFVRDIPRNNESSFWPRVSNRIEGRLNQAAVLRGLEEISPGGTIQVIPYAAGRVFDGIDPGARSGPARDEDEDLDFGVDGKFVFRDTLVLDATVNPDFSEVESDLPQVTVNERFEVFFPERRPFFLENPDFFVGPINLLFTRRIRDPSAGGRLTGKLGKFNLGALLIDDGSPPEADDPDSDARGEDALFGVLRVTRDLGAQSRVGFVLTDRELADGYNRIAGFDGRFKINDHWTGTAQAVLGRTRLQDGTELDGPALEAVVERDGREFETHIHYIDRDPEFRTQTGFVPRVDIRELHQSTEYRIWPAGDRLIRWGPSLFWQYVEDHDGTRLDWRIEPELSWELRRQTRVEVQYTIGRELLRPQDFAGLDGNVEFDREEIELTFESRHVSSLETRVELGAGTAVNFVPPEGEVPEEADLARARFDLTVRPTRRLRLDGQYFLTRLSDADDGGRIFTDHIGRLRASFQFTRRLSLRAIVEYDTTRIDPERTRLPGDRNLNGDVLLTYLVSPFTALYAGYNSNYSDLRLADDAGIPTLVRTGRLANDADQVFVKFSYMFRF